jgi:alpha-tubulin suppressor-like RCC1 family protein
MLKISMSLGLTAFLFFFSPEVLAHTTVSATSTGTGFWEQISTYDWAVDRNVLTEIIEIKPGTTEQVEYSILATRSSPSVGPIQQGERGQVCVTNGGAESTQALRIVNQLQSKTLAGTNWSNVTGSTQTITPSIQLAPSESRCFTYEVPKATPFSTSRVYRNRANVTITNFTGHGANAFGPTVLTPFSNPTLSNFEIDGALSGSETLTCPTGFTCIPASVPLSITTSGTTNYSISVTNDSTDFCEFALANTLLALVEVDSLQAHQSLDQVMITTGKPPVVARLFVTGNSALGSHPTGSTSEATLYVINAGGAVASSMSGTVTGDYFAFKGGTYPGTGGTCSSSLPINAECTLEVEFNPDVDGDFSGLMTLNYSNGQAAASASRTIEGTAVTPPAPIIISKIRSSSGGSFSCALRSNGSVKCWGLNTSGQLGQGDLVNRGGEPDDMGDNLFNVDLGVGLSAKNIAAGGRHACVILQDDRVKCWGRNDSGQLGLGDTDDRGDATGEMGDALPFVNLGTGRTAKALALGSSHSCAILDNDEIKCWGSGGSGQLGQGDTQIRGDNSNEMGDNLPIVNLGTQTPINIEAGSSSTCALLANEAVKCWGSNGSGRLGLGDTQSRGDQPGEMGSSLPEVQIGSGRSVKKLSVGDSHVCVVLDNNLVKCWGNNGNGELGIGNQFDRGSASFQMGDNLAIADLGTGRTAKNVSAGQSHTCATLDDDTLKCWGGNNTGHLGLGDTTVRGTLPGQMGDSLPLVSLGFGRTVKSIDLGAGFSCVILDNDSLKCWGANGSGQLGSGDTDARGDGPNEMGEYLNSVDLGILP